VENACAGSPYDNPHHFTYADADPITDIYANLDSRVTNLNASYQYPPSDVYTHAEAAYGHTSSISNVNAPTLILEIGDDFDTDTVMDFL